MNPERISFPFLGQSEALASSKQMAKTTRRSKNARSFNCRNDRMCGSQRGGFKEFNSNPLSVAKVQALCSAIFDNSRSTYADDEEPTTLLSIELPAKQSGLTGVYDDLGNIYVAESPASVVKYNSAGAVLWKIALDPQDPKSVCAALCVDRARNVYVAVSSSQRQIGRIWKYTQLDDNQFQLHWSLDLLAFVADMKVTDDLLYTAQNRPNAYEADLVVYRNLDSANPTETGRRRIPYPATSIAVGSDKAVRGTATAFNYRKIDKRHPDFCKQRIEHWKLDDLPRKGERVWAHYDATNIDGQNNATLKDGDEILEWLDLSGNGRHLRYEPPAANRPPLGTVYGDHGALQNAEYPPVFAKKAIGDMPGVRFRGDNTGASTAWFGSTLVSGVNESIVAEKKEEQRTMLPAYTGSMFALVATLRPDDTTEQGVVFGQRNGAISSDRLLAINTGWAGGVFTTVAGQLHYHDRGSNTDQAQGNTAGANPTPPAGRFDNKARTVVVSIVCDGGVQAGTGGAQRSLYRVLGAPIDRYTSRANTLSTTAAAHRGRTTLGRYDGSGLGFYKGVIGEIVVFDRYNSTELVGEANGGNSLVEDVIQEPRSSGGAGYETGTAGTFNVNSDSELEREEGRQAWKFGIPHLLDDGLGTDPAAVQWDAEGAHSDEWVHPFSTQGPLDTAAAAPFQLANSSNAPPNPEGKSADSHERDLLSPYQILWKIGPAFDNHRWVMQNANTSGIGIACVVSSDATSVITIGPKQGADQATVRRILDKGDTFDATTAPAWAWIGGDWTSVGQKLALDKFDNVYIPWFDVDKDDTSVPTPIAENQTLAMIQYAGPSLGPQGPQILYRAPLGQQGLAAMPAQIVPDYGASPVTRAPYFWVVTRAEDYNVLTALQLPSDGQTVTLGSRVYTFKNTLGAANQVKIEATVADTLVSLKHAINDTGVEGTDYGTGTLVHADIAASLVTSTTLQIQARVPGTTAAFSSTTTGWTFASLAYLKATQTLFKVQQVTQTQTAGSPREMRMVGVSNGNLLEFNKGSGAPTIPTGGNGCFDANAPWVNLEHAYGEVWGTDGKHAVRYNPKTRIVTPWISSTSGEIPLRYRHMKFWRGRAIFGRGLDDPHNFFMTQMGEPTKTDVIRQVQIATQAVVGNVTPGIGRCPDVINTLVPINDDNLWFGGDHTIHAMSGDPADFGRVTLFTDQTGIAPGPRPWTRDPLGALYFISPKCVVYRYDGESLEAMTEGRVQRDLSSVDLNTHYFELIWNEKAHGLHVLLMPYGAGGSAVKAWFWEKGTKELVVDAWWPDEHGWRPTCSFVVDGDSPDDREVLFGGEDGKVCFYDPTEATDNGELIESEVLIGPFQVDPEFDTFLQGVKARLGSEFDGCFVDIYVSSDPDDPGDPVSSFEVREGFNEWTLLRESGAYVWLGLRNSTLGRHWSLEDLLVRYRRGSRQLATQ